MLLNAIMELHLQEEELLQKVYTKVQGWQYGEEGMHMRL